MEDTMRMHLLITMSLLSLFANNNLVEATIDIGINYGMQGNNLPSHADTVALLKKYGIGKIRLLDPVLGALDALKGSGIDVTIGIRNQDLPNLAASKAATKKWFDTYVQPYVNDIQFSYIIVGNEVNLGEFEFGPYVLYTLLNLQYVLSDYQYAGIKTTTVIAKSALGISFPPSAGRFKDDLVPTISVLLEILSKFSSPLMVNVYPYFAYATNPENARLLEYTLFNATEPLYPDGKFGYTNMLDAELDAVYSAMERLGAKNVDLVVAESGWPSAGNKFTDPELAGTYNRNFVKKLLAKTGTPKRPNSYIEGFVYAVYNENLKPAGVERNFGLFFPDGTPVYPVFT